jgi:hypothetical protein
MLTFKLFEDRKSIEQLLESNVKYIFFQFHDFNMQSKKQHDTKLNEDKTDSDSRLNSFQKEAKQKILEELKEAGISKQKVLEELKETANSSKLLKSEPNDDCIFKMDLDLFLSNSQIASLKYEDILVDVLKKYCTIEIETKNKKRLASLVLNPIYYSDIFSSSMGTQPESAIPIVYH